MDELPLDLRQNLEKMKKKKYLHSHSNETFDDIFIPWLIDDERIEEPLSEISSKYLLSTFVLTYLHYINNALKEKYTISKFNSEDLTDARKLKEIKKEINQITDDHMISWLKDEGLPQLNMAVNLININDPKDIAKVGAIEDLMITALRQGAKNSEDDFYIYDILYQLIERLKERGFLKPEGTKQIKVREVIREITIETDSETTVIKDEDQDIKDWNFTKTRWIKRG